MDVCNQKEKQSIEKLNWNTYWNVEEADGGGSRYVSLNALECIDGSVLFVVMDTYSLSEFGDDWCKSPFLWKLDGNGLDIL